MTRPARAAQDPGGDAMSQEGQVPPGNDHPHANASDDVPMGMLMQRLSEQTSRLIRDELRLAQVELKETVKHAGLGAGMFGAAGLVALYGAGVLVATAVIALALVLPWWLSALIVAAVLLAAAGVMALIGKKQVEQVSPTPERAIENVKRDVDTIKEARSA